MEVIKKINLDFYDNQIITVDAKQYDVLSRYIQVSCSSNGTPVHLEKENVYAYVRCRKPDEHNVLNNGTITDDGNLLIELSDQILASPGICLTDVVLVDTSEVGSQAPTITDDWKLQFDGSSSIISTMNFYINVIPAPYAYDDIISSDDFTTLNNLLDQVHQNYNELATLLPGAQEAASIAQDAAERAQEYAASVDLSSVIQSSSTEPQFQPINGLWLREI